MFKGGVEQSSMTEEKPLNGIDPSQKIAEWKVIKVRRTSYLQILTD